MAMVINFVVNPAFSLMPILVTKYFGRGALQLGWLESVWGIGVVVGGLVLSVWGGFKRRVVTSLLGIIGMGIGTLIVGLAPVSVFTMALAGDAGRRLHEPDRQWPLHGRDAVVRGARDAGPRLFTDPKRVPGDDAAEPADSRPDRG